MSVEHCENVNRPVVKETVDYVIPIWCKLEDET